ncbi:MAG: PaaI family thioesterase [Chloroflexota bacterium]
MNVNGGWWAPEATESETINDRIGVRADHHCFGCGRLNPCGLQLSFYDDPETGGVWAPWTPDQRHEGYDGITHGGVITAVLDEVMAWTAYRQRIWAVTGKLSVTFRRPVQIGEPVRAAGRLVADRGRIIELAGTLHRERDGQVLAEAVATFFRVPEAQARAWEERYVGS